MNTVESITDKWIPFDWGCPPASKMPIESITDKLVKIALSPRCSMCMGNIKDDVDCASPRHQGYREKKVEVAVEIMQERKFGAYVNPKTGRIVKAKALNNPMTLGKE